MTYTYHRLTPNDLADFRALMAMFGAAFADVAAYGANPPREEYVRSLLAKPHFIALVAREADRVIGGLAAYVLEKFERERSEVYIYDLAVAEEHRRRGVATRLIGVLKPLAKAMGAYVIFVQADVGDAPAVSLYESLGKREDVHHFDIEVD